MEQSINDQEERRLLSRVRELDPEAITETHQRYYAPIHRYIAFKVQDKQDAEDLTSEVFVRLLSAVQDRTAPDRTLRGWLFGVAFRVVSAYYRNQYRVEETELSTDLPARNPNVDTDVNNQLIAEYIRRQVKKLTPDQQEVVALRYSYDIPFREVAEIMGKSEAAVKMLHARAMKALAQQIGREIRTHGG